MIIEIKWTVQSINQLIINELRNFEVILREFTFGTW